jgi:predicted DNA-binding transcriptional regulator AlpA
MTMATLASPPTEHVDDNAALLIDSVELARQLNMSERSVWRFAARGQLPSPVRIAGVTRWRAAEIRAWTNAGCPPTEQWEGIGKRTA